MSSPPLRTVWTKTLRRGAVLAVSSNYLEFHHDHQRRSSIYPRFAARARDCCFYYSFFFWRFKALLDRFAMVSRRAEPAPTSPSAHRASLAALAAPRQGPERHAGPAGVDRSAMLVPSKSGQQSSMPRISPTERVAAG